MSMVVPLVHSCSPLTAGRVFEVLFTQCSDLSLDIPAVDKLLARFVARAVSDDILPPGFITEWLATPSYYHIVQQAVVLLRCAIANVCVCARALCADPMCAPAV